MSNLYRSNPNGESNYRIINSNAMMDEIIQAHLAEEEERKKKNGAFAPVSFEEVEEGEDMERDTSMDALFMDGEEIREGDDGESLEQANADAEAILEEARQQADGILADAEGCREPFTRIYGYCLAGCFFMHMLINIGMTIGLMPVIGIPLPFISYGGSSMLSFTVMLSVFLALLKQERRYF